MAYQTLIVEVEDKIALVRLNRPEAMNALNGQLIGELADALGTLDADDKVLGVVPQGGGGQHLYELIAKPAGWAAVSCSCTAGSTRRGRRPKAMRSSSSISSTGIMRGPSRG